jgi:hypothetical protein
MSALLLVGVVLVMAPGDAAFAQLEWTQMNVSGFGDPDNQFSAFSMAMYNGSYYVGTGSWGDVAQVWRYDGPDPSDWTKVSPDGFGTGIDIVTDLKVFNGMLYASCFQRDSGGAEVWAYDGSTWTRVAEGGFGDPSTRFAWVFEVFDGLLWCGTTSDNNGANVWAYDGSVWQKMNTDGFGNPNNRSVRSLEVFDGTIFAGVFNADQGAELWRYDGPNPSNWTQIGSGGFGEPLNVDARSLAAFNGRLMIGTANDSVGSQVLAYDGSDIQRIDPGTLQYDVARAMAVGGSAKNTGSTLYVTTANVFGSPPGMQVWAYDGENWELVNPPGFGDPSNDAGHSILAGDSMLLVGVNNNDAGGQVWATPIEGGGGLMYLSHVAAAAAAQGAEGAYFQTDLDLNNTAMAALAQMDVEYEFWWLPRGEDNSDPLRSETFTLGAGQSVRIENALVEIFGLEPDAVGAIAIAASSPSLIGMSRTYNIPGEKVAGTFGQALPAVPEDELIQAGETRRIIFMSENSDFRANVGCTNGTDMQIRIELDLYDAAGTPLETRTMTLDPWSNKQLNRVFRAYQPVSGYIDVRSTTNGAKYYCYGSVLDNVTSDPTTILPQVPSSGMRYYVPAAALAAGAEGAFFQTDVDVNNSGSDASFVFMWLPRGEDNSSPTQSDSFNLGATMSVRYENVLSEVFGAEPDVVGALGMQSASEDLLSMSRTYNVPAGKVAGTFGQALPGIQEGDMIGPDDRRRIIFLSENDDLRANVGCTSGAGVETRVRIELFNAAGDSLATRNMVLAPWSNNQLNRIFRDFSPVNGYVDVWSETEGAMFYCYGSVLDNATSDPTTILPQQ